MLDGYGASYTVVELNEVADGYPLRAPMVPGGADGARGEGLSFQSIPCNDLQAAIGGGSRFHNSGILFDLQNRLFFSLFEIIFNTRVDKKNIVHCLSFLRSQQSYLKKTQNIRFIQIL